MSRLTGFCRPFFLPGILLSIFLGINSAHGSRPSTEIREQPSVKNSSNKVMWNAVPVPEQAPCNRSGMADLPGVRLWYSDTGGDGPTVVLSHAHSGSADFWGYQQPVLTKAGYRVITYSRRGHGKSERGNETDFGFADVDLHNLVVTFLGVDKFHLVGVAAGGGIAIDYALSHPERLISLTIASSLIDVIDPEYVKLLSNLHRKDLTRNIPNFYIELSASYRAGNPSERRRGLSWRKLVMSGDVQNLGKISQRHTNKIIWKAVDSIKVPTLLMTGDADSYVPPSLLRLQASHMKHAEVLIISEAGHAPNWEQPEAFNSAVLKFFQKQDGTTGGQSTTSPANKNIVTLSAFAD
ncbi:hypothetical protein BV898_02609 [Hypsibius exemplaris]|uniref:AB hydrolase-1 domain-containing protein n=1 Tax=Hypsibius exemplaris TaxID=2072580 RepID=A0A1W0X844_HYPEX|nr:hypothetical protein BV898_02609 [Hypsibius exemplaris]